MTEQTAIEEDAARWHARTLSGAFSAQDEQRLEAWLAEDLRHRLAYADVAAAAFAAEQGAPRVPIPMRAPRRWPAWTAAALAPALLLLLVLWTPHAWQDWHSDAHTAIGATRTQTLPDGSVLQLDTDSAVALPFTPERRDIELLRGRLAIAVAKDPAHPLRVHCAGVEARAVGTRFVVARRDDGVDVEVSEGIVAVRASEAREATLVHAGERVRIDAAGTPHADALPAGADAWTRGVLSFDGVPLPQAVAEIARYLPEHVAFRAARHTETKVTATFPIEQPDAALAALAKTNGLTLRRVPHVLYLVED